jgi:putative flippase GtrA
MSINIVGLLRGRRARIARFLAVGGTCFAIQFALLTGLVRLGVDRPVANAIAFAGSAQLNFLLSSRLTWADRPAGTWRQGGARLLAYNLTALVSLGVDSGVFVLAYRATGTLPAAGLGVVTSTALVYLICNRLVFRSAPRMALAVAAYAEEADQ